MKKSCNKSSFQLKLKQDVAGAFLLGACPLLMEMLYRVLEVFVWEPIGIDREWNRWLVGPTMFDILILGAIAGLGAPAIIR